MAASSSSANSSRKKVFGCTLEDEEDSGGFLPQAGEITRTNTDVTLVGGTEENCGSALKS